MCVCACVRVCVYRVNNKVNIVLRDPYSVKLYIIIYMPVHNYIQCTSLCSYNERRYGHTVI